MVKSLVIAGAVNGSTSTANQTQYWNINGIASRSSVENSAQRPIYEDGVFSRLFFRLSANTMTSGTTVFTLRKNVTTDTAMTASVPFGQTGTFEDLTNTVSVTSGDKFALKGVPGATTGTFTMTYISLIFTPTDTNVCLSFLSLSDAPGGSGLTGASTRYFYPANAYLNTGTPNTTEATSQFKAQISGTLKNMTTWIISNSRTTDTVAEIRKNGVSQSLKTTYTSTQTLGKTDLSNTVSVADNDLINFSILNGTGTSAISWAYLTVEFETTGSTAQCLLHVHSQVLAALARNITRYMAISGYFDYVSTEANTQYTVNDSGFTAKNLSVNITQNSITNDSTFALRKNGSTVISIPITQSQTGWWEDTSTSVSLADGDLLNYIITSGAGSGTQTITVRTAAVHLEATSLRNLTQTISDSVTLTGGSPVNLRGLIQTQSNSLTISESIPRLRLLLQTNSDSVSIGAGSPVNLRGLNQTSSDSLTLTHTSTSRLRLLLQLISDSVSITHATSYTNRTKLRAFSQALTLSESIPKITTRLRTISDSLTLTHTSTNRLRLLLQTFSDSLTLSDTRSWFSTRIRTISQSLGISESISRLKNINRSIGAQSIGFSESISRLRNKLRIPNQDVLYFLRFDVDLDDWVEGLDILRSTERIRTVSDSVGFSESISRLRGLARSISSQSLTITESMDRLTNRLRTLSESMGLSHGLSRITTRLKTISDLISLTSDTVRTRMKTGILNESGTLSESIQKITTRLRTINHSITFNDLIQTGSAKIKLIFESIEFEESVDRLTGKLRTIPDSLVLTDSIQTLRMKLRLLSQSLTLSDNLTYQTSRLRGFTDNLSFTDLIEKGGANLVKTISETLDFSHTNTRLTTRLRIISESLTVAEGITRITTRLRTISHSVTLSDVISQSKEFVKMISDSISFTHTNSKLTTRLRTISNSLSLSESTTNVKSRIRTIQQSLTLTSSTVQDALSSIIKTISEELSIVDGAERVLGKLRTVSDSLTLSSTTQRIRPIVIKTINEMLSLTESTSRLRLLVIRGVNHNLVLSSTALRFVKSASKQFLIKIRRFKTFKYR